MENYEEFGRLTMPEAIQKAVQEFHGSAKLYVVLDYAVCFGVYQNGQFLVGLGEEKEATMLEWKYVRELRIFDTNKEMLLISNADGWSGRVRNDLYEGKREYCLTERQKLWGQAAKNSQKVITGWTLLVSGRGTRIQIPEQLSEGEAAALSIRRYMRIPDVKKDEELVFQKDVRIVGIGVWKGTGGDDESV